MQINMQIDNKEMQNNHKECHKTLMTLENDNRVIILKSKGPHFYMYEGFLGFLIDITMIQFGFHVLHTKTVYYFWECGFNLKSVLFFLSCTMWSLKTLIGHCNRAGNWKMN